MSPKILRKAAKTYKEKDLFTTAIKNNKKNKFKFGFKSKKKILLMPKREVSKVVRSEEDSDVDIMEGMEAVNKRSIDMQFSQDNKLKNTNKSKFKLILNVED